MWIRKIKFLYNSQEAVMKLFNDYSSIVSEAKYKSTHREGLKILIPKQMLQRYSICTNKSRKYIWKLYIFFVTYKRNY